MAEGSKGITIFEGVDAQHVGNYSGAYDQCPSELRVYRAYEAKTATSLLETFKIVKYEEIWTKFDIHFDVEMISVCKDILSKIKIESNRVAFTADEEAYSTIGDRQHKISAYDLSGVAFEVAKDAILDIENDSDINCGYTYGEGDIHVATGSTLYVNRKVYSGHQATM